MSYFATPGLPARGPRRLTDAQVLTTAQVAARFFGGNLVVAKHYLAQHWSQNRLDRSGFTRRLHALTDTRLALFATVGNLLKHSTPMPATRTTWPKTCSTRRAVAGNKQPAAKIATGRISRRNAF